MSDGNTLIGNALVGHGLEQGDATQGEAYLAEEEAVIVQEDHLMSEVVTSEEDENMERQMLTVALVNSVVQTAQQSPASTDASKSPDDDSKQRYSLRKRRRPSGDKTLEEPGEHPPLAKIEPSAGSQLASAAAKAAPRQAVAQKGPPAKPIQQKIVPLHSKPMKTRVKVKSEAVPACTIAVAAAPLPVPLAASSLPKPSSLPPALQPPRRPSLPPRAPPKAAANASSRATRPKPTKDKAKRLVPAARVQVSSTPLTPNPTATGVPNPLSNPLPASKTVPVTKPKTVHPSIKNTQASSAHAFKAGTKLTVPCPLPPSTFQSNVEQKGPAHPGAPEAAPAPEKKKVTIDLPPAQQRGRIFSIDLDPASLDFSVLDSGDSGTPAPASADLPLVTGDGRDRAFSFECFAFGINADEPLETLGTTPADLAQQQDLVALPSTRPRGDSIIFDPSSFQEGGIHEERALTTRESRGMSVDLEAAGLLPPSSDTGVDKHPGQHYEHPYPPQSVPSSSVVTPAPGKVTPHPPATHSHIPDSAHSGHHVSIGHPPHHAPVTHSHHHAHPGAHHHSYHHPPTTGVPHPVVVSSGHEMPPGHTGAVSIISSCASSTTLQMELLNKDGRIGIYLPEARKERIARFHAKRKMRIWRKRIKYDCRKKLADSRPRIKGRFVKRTDTD